MGATYEQEASVNHLHDVITWDALSGTAFAINLLGVLELLNKLRGYRIEYLKTFHVGNSLKAEKTLG